MFLLCMVCFTLLVAWEWCNYWFLLFNPAHRDEPGSVLLRRFLIVLFVFVLFI